MCLFVGYVSTIDAFSCARVCKHLGAGRSFAGQKLDLSVGITLTVEVGDHIETGKTVFKVLKYVLFR